MTQATMTFNSTVKSAMLIGTFVTKKLYDTLILYIERDQLGKDHTVDQSTTSVINSLFLKKTVSEDDNLRPGILWGALFTVF